MYLDDCAFSYRLRQLLIEAGHEVQIPADVEPSLRGARDETHFQHVLETNQIILTLNPDDFYELHRKHPEHAGVFAVYRDNDPTRDMTYRDIVRAIDNIQQLGVSIKGEFWSLNAYQW